MSHPTKLPDAMPDIVSPTLLIVCDSHHCRFIDVGGHTLLEKEGVDSKELVHTDRQDSQPSPSSFGKGGMMSGVGEEHHAEENRLRDFAIMIVDRMTALVGQQGIESVYLSAPSRLLSEIKKHMPATLTKVLKSTIDGIFIKESNIEVLKRFRPDLDSSVVKLRDMENYSSKKHLPK